MRSYDIKTYNPGSKFMLKTTIGFVYAEKCVETELSYQFLNRRGVLILSILKSLSFLQGALLIESDGQILFEFKKEQC